MKLLRIRFALALLPLLAVLLGGCGYHLRGAVELPDHLKRVYLSDESRSPELMLGLKRNFQISGLEVLSAPSADASTVRVLRVEDNRNVSGHDANRAAAQYRLFLRVTYAVVNGGTPGAGQAATVSASQSYSYDPDEPVEMERQERLILEQLTDNIAGQILRRLAAGN